MTLLELQQLRTGDVVLIRQPQWRYHRLAVVTNKGPEGFIYALPYRRSLAGHTTPKTYRKHWCKDPISVHYDDVRRRVYSSGFLSWIGQKQDCPGVLDTGTQPDSEVPPPVLVSDVQTPEKTIEKDHCTEGADTVDYLDDYERKLQEGEL